MSEVHFGSVQHKVVGDLIIFFPLWFKLAYGSTTHFIIFRFCRCCSSPKAKRATMCRKRFLVAKCSYSSIGLEREAYVIIPYRNLHALPPSRFAVQICVGAYFFNPLFRLQGSVRKGGRVAKMNGLFEDMAIKSLII